MSQTRKRYSREDRLSILRDYYFSGLSLRSYAKQHDLKDGGMLAKDMAYRKSKFIPNGKPHILRYEFDEKHLTDGTLKVKVFESPTEEWAQFIIDNRYNPDNKQIHDYDVVIGSIADDGVALQIELFRDGFIDLASLAKGLEYKKLNK